jgi:hypothetical protein
LLEYLLDVADIKLLVECDVGYKAEDSLRKEIVLRLEVAEEAVIPGCGGHGDESDYGRGIFEGRGHLVAGLRWDDFCGDERWVCGVDKREAKEKGQ